MLKCKPKPKPTIIPRSRISCKVTTRMQLATRLSTQGLALEWSAEEQSILEEALINHSSQMNNLVKYIKIAALLNEKTVRDVALRVRWMTKKENGKRRKDEVQTATKKTKDKKDKAEATSKAMPASNVLSRSPMPMYSPPIDNDDGISNHAIGGETGVLLEQNAQVIAQIRSNLASMKMQENTDLLVRFRDNIFAILNGMTNMPGIMSQMPPLPVKLNTELADSILPKSQASTPLLLQS
uniref:Myb-like domain-containing protein n=1 Tax=Physcomitrium patens TaxID=3218 RepID=A0A7I4AMU1_PHYPA